MKFDKETQDQITDLFASYAKSDSPGFAVGIIYDNNMIFGQGFGQATLEHFSPINTKTVFDVGSIAKQFVGMAIALLEEDGILSISDNIKRYLPELPDYARQITLENLLYHTSGIRNYTVLAYYMMGYHESDAITRDEVFDLLVNLRSTNFKPGEKWEYSDSNYFLLAEIIERVTGESLNSSLKELIFIPLDMQNTLFRERHSQVIRNRAVSYVPHPIEFRSPYLYRKRQEASGLFYTLISNYEHVGAEGLFTTLEDLSKWDRNFLGNRLGKEDPGLITKILSPGVRINENTGYGFGINIGKFKGKDFYGHDGAIHGYTSSMMHFPEENATIICLANHNLVGSWEYRNRIMDLIFSSSNSMALPVRSHHEGVNLEDQRIIGLYQNPETASIWEITCKNNAFFVTENNNWEFRLYRVAPATYRVEQPCMELKFEVDSTGKVREINGVLNDRPFRFVPFLSDPHRTADLMEYIGQYRSDELDITFNVEIDNERIIVRNENKHFCSMDLNYAPTIKDNFIAYDPHPTSSQITFLRKDGRIASFVYRDYDGDGREAIRFDKVDR